MNTTRFSVIPIAAVALAAIGGCQADSSPPPTATQAQATTTETTSPPPEYYWTAPKQQETALGTVAPTMWPTMSGEGLVWSNLAYPANDPEARVIGVEKGVPAEVRLNQPFNYRLVVTNLSENPVNDVVVYDNLQDGLKITKSNPSGEMVDDSRMAWTIGKLEPGASKIIDVTGSASRSGTLGSCADVSYERRLCSTFSVVQPELKVALRGPQDALLCDDLEYQIDISNVGTGSIRNARISQPLPEGLTTINGANTLDYNIGTLAAGESRTLRAHLRADRPGDFAFSAKALGEDGLTASSPEVKTMIREPKLTISTTGPESRYLGRTAEYQIVVTNSGDGVARNTTVEEEIPFGVEFVSASRNGQRLRNQVHWNLGDLKPNESRTVTVTLNAKEAGSLSRSVRASADCAKEVRAGTTTMYEGISAVLLEVADMNDPVQVGDTTTYVITATNQGTAPATNLRIACTLEANTMFLNAEGASMFTRQEGQVLFQPLPSLAPKGKAVWRVVVKAVTPGDVRFKAVLTSDQLTRPVEETEATKVYQ